MPIVIGLGKTEWKDPLNIYGGKPQIADQAQPKVTQVNAGDADRRDLVNTIIAEAAGEGDTGMAAVASVIRNRAERRGKSPAEVIREPNQFTGYSKPGPGAVEAMNDPAMRQKAESILDQVLAGQLPDPTGGADHYHADSVAPGWANDMPKTAQVGRHLFYRAESGPDTRKRVPSYDELANQPGLSGGVSDPFEAVLSGAPARQPKGGGMADLLTERPEPVGGKPGALAFVHQGQDKLDPVFRGILEDTSMELGLPFTIQSGYRGAGHAVERRKKQPGEHSHGTASDISMKGMDEAQRQKLVRGLLARGAKRFITYSNSPDMLHVDMKDQTGNGTPWFMHDKTAANIGRAPAWFQEIAKNPGDPVAAPSAVATPATAQAGNAIVIDENFKSSDGMGLLAAGPNPFDALAAQRRQAVEQDQAAAADQAEQNRIRAYNERHNAEVGQQAAQLDAENPGRYIEIDEQSLPDWQRQWDDENRSGGLAGDTARILESGAIGVGQSLSSLSELILNKLPGGQKFMEISDQIDRWLIGKPLEQVMTDQQDRARASVTERQQEADAKNWWDSEKGFFGPAWSDPRSYLRTVGESVPATVVTMAPGGILARGAYLRTIAAGGTQRAAAAAAARTATLSGALLEGTMGGADSARNVRQRIDEIPRDQLLQAEAVQDLISGGMSEDDAIRAIREDAATQAFLISGVATGIFGGMGDRALAKIVAEGVGGGLAQRILSGAMRGMVAEGVLEEAPQGAAQTIAENQAMQRVNPDQPLTEGVGEAVASGIAAGGVMGGGMGGIGGAASRQPAPAPTATDGVPSEPAPTPAPVTPEPAATAPPETSGPAGPIGRAVRHAEQQLMQKNAGQGAAVANNGTGTAPASPSARPDIGATVRIDADGIEPFMGRIDAYEGDEAVVIDSGSGEVYQIPIANVTQIARPVADLARELPQDRGPVPVNDAIPDYSADPALEPLPPIAATATSEALPPAKEQRPALERFPTAPDPGRRVIVDDKSAGRFPAKIERWVDNGNQALVVDDSGKEYQVPADSLFISNLTDKQIDEQELKRNPPVAREKPKDVPNARAVLGKTVVMPDDKHARLFDLGRDRFVTKKTLGASQLDLGNVNAPELQRLADDFKVLPQAIEAMADDYRYRVERAAKQARSDLPQNMATVNDQRLAQWQRERAKADPMSPAQAESAGAWWDGELTAQERRRILDAAGVKRSERMKWSGMTPAIQKKLEAFRTGAEQGEPSAAPAGERVFTTAKGSSYTLHADGTTTRVKAERTDPGHEGDKGLKKRSDRTIFVATNAGALSAAGLNGIGSKGARVAIRDNKATLVTWNEKEGRWGAADSARDIPFTSEPSVGAYPLEVWDRRDDVPGYEAYARMHAGNKIVEIADNSGGNTDKPAAPADTVDAAANEAATSPTNDRPEPTQAQKEAGNYKVGRISLGGLDISIENPAGSERKGVDANGKPWSVEMKSHYGYIRGTVGRDKDHIDVFVKPGTESLEGTSPVFVVDQMNRDGSFDEHKVMLGYGSQREAEKAYLENYTKGWKLGPVSEATLGQFKQWLKDGDTTAPAVSSRNDKWFNQAPQERQDQSDAAKESEKLIGASEGDLVRTKGEGRDLQANSLLTVTKIDADGAVTFTRRGGLPSTFTQKELRAEIKAGTAFEPVERKSEPPAERKQETKPPVSENTVFTADAAEKARALLRRKLNQLNSGIDPEIMQAGITLAGYHIERGARTFAAYAAAMLADLGETARPYLKSWYMGVKYDPRASAFEGMSGAAEVDAIDVDTIAVESQNEPAELERDRETALEGVPAEPVPAAEGGRQAGAGSGSGRGADVPGDQPAGRERSDVGRRVADDAGAVSSAASRDAGATAEIPDGGSNGGSAKRAKDTAGKVNDAQRSIDQLKDVQSAAVPAQQVPVDFTISADDAIGQGGAKAKFAGNIAAIKVLRQIEAENRPATRDEQTTLAKWVGWGGLRDAFYRERGEVAKGWEKQAAELKALLTADEYAAAESSTRNAHYTSPQIVAAVWDVVGRLGFRGGQLLEPSVGAGNFLGLMPAELRIGTRVTGVELDRITGGIAKNLYPGANIQAPMGFEKFTVPNDYFDLAIGNPPFGSEKLYDKERRHLNKLSIHNFFFAKSMEALRPGGVLAMVVTNRFLDGNNSTARALISKQADLVAAIRLPNNAFLKNAGTEVTTDIVILRKRAAGEAAASTAWTDVGTYRGADGKDVPLNAYFIENPDMMLGDFGAFGTMYGPDEPALVARPNQDLSADLAAAISKLPRDIMSSPGSVVATTEEVADSVETAAVGSLFLADGAVHQRLPDNLGRPQSKRVEMPNTAATERVSGMIRIRDAFARLRRAQIDEHASDTQIENLRALLNKVYDGFVKKHGPINADVNKRLFRDDPTWPQISALENGFDKGISAAVAKATGETARPPSAMKAAIFSRRTQQPFRPPTSASSAKDALAQSLNTFGRIDLQAMSRLYGKPADDIVSELGSLIYRTPAGGYETADGYLSGNVKQKLAEAERAAETDPQFRRNVAALRDVIPADIEPVDIDVKPGAPWIPPTHIESFIHHITERQGAKAFFSKANGKWSLEIPAASPASDARWATGRTNVAQILNAVLNGQAVQVYTKNAEGNAVLDQAASDAGNEKAERIKSEWQRWLWDEDARRDELARLYNDTFNTDVTRVYDGSHLSLPGKVSDDVIELRPHQKSFVWRTLQSPVALADHTVGAGKTFALIAAAMEKRRLGQARKPMFVVPNHLVGQWAADFIKLYPGANVLATTKRDFEKENRKRLFARVATGDWDAVIVAHSSFGKIGMSPEVEAKFVQQQVDELESSIEELRAQTGQKSRNVAQLTKWRDNLKSKMERLLDAGRKDDGLTFDELGVDALFVDEFHEFKNLPFATGMQRVAGLGNPMGSQKAADMFMKLQFIQEKTGGNIVPATGTPLSNTMAEMYTLQRYLDNTELQRMGLSHFDAWARVFGDVVTDWELSPSGQYKLNSRFARFVNMPELMARYRSFADVVSNDDIKAQLAAQGKKLPLPRVRGGKPTNLVVERSPDQARYIGEGRMGDDGNLRFPEGSLVYRAENLPKKAEKGADNMLKVMSDARKAALDMRLIDPSYGDYEGSKVNRAAQEMKRIYDQWADQRGTQLVFIDLSTPKKAQAREEAELRDLIRKAEEGDEAAQEKLDDMSPDAFLALQSKFSVYDDLRQKLIDLGIPSNEIAFIHDANTELQKEELFGKVRSGRIRFLFGSTPKMGAGTNVQNRLVALHHLDAPWRPSDLEQRDGRGIRQGNELYAQDPDGFEIEIMRYATKNTLDARQWQGIEAKANFIQQVRKGDMKSRQIEDIAGEAANAAEMKAAASGNPLILEEMETRRRLRTLEAQAVEHEREQHRIKGKIRSVGEELAAIEERRADVATDAAAAADLADKPFEATVRGQKVERPKDFGAAMLSAMRQAIIDGIERMDMGSYAGMKIAAEHLYDGRFNVSIKGARTYNIGVPDVAEQDATGLAMQVINTIKRLPSMPAIDEERAAELTKQLPALERQIGPWPMAQDLADTAANHRRLIDALKPKAKASGADADASASTAAVMQPKMDKGPDPVISIQTSLRSVARPERQEGQSLLDYASKAVLEKGQATGHEYLMAIDDDGTTVEFGTADNRSAVGLSASLASAMANPDRRMVLFHNHPANGPVSVQDITQLAYPGVYSVWALGHGGKNTRVSLTAQARDVLGIETMSPAELGRVVNRINAALRDADGGVAELLQSRVTSGTISTGEASNAHHEARPMIAAAAGLIDYSTNEPYDVANIPGLDRVIDSAALKIARTLLNERSAKTIADAGVHRSPEPVRHVAELEGLARGRQQVAADQSGPGGLREGSPRDYSPENGRRVTRERIKTELNGRLIDIQPAVLKTIPLNYFTDLARPNMKAVGEYLRVKRLMDAFRGQKHADADAIAGAWLKYSRLGLMGKDKTKAREMSELMHDSTLAGIDPSKTDDETIAKAGYQILRKRYMALPPAGRDLYQKVRDAYARQAEELDAILLDNVRKAQQIALDRAADRYKRTMQKIRDAGLPPMERRKAEEDATSAYKAESTKSTWAAKARMTKMRIAFESSRVQEPYFPLGRFGRYFVTVRDIDGAVLSFSKFERAADRDRFAADIAKDYPAGKIEKGVMEQGSDLRRAMDPRLVAEIEEMLGGAGVDAGIMDQIWQRYLETMPDLSTRKRFIHRKGTAGYNSDALRVFSSHMFHAAHQMARMKYGLELQELVDQTIEQAREADDQTRAMTLANELSKRHDWVMNPTGSKVAQVMTSTAFVWFLAASPASAAVNMTQTVMMGLPILGARFGGLGKAAAALAKASSDSISGKGTVTRANLMPDESAALQTFYDSGLIDRTQSHDLAGVGDTGVEYSPLRARVMGVISWAFHRAEVWNREVTALAAYRMARASGQTHMAAIDTAHDLTWQTHFDYSNSGRPTVLQNDLAKVALVFRQHNINMLYRLFRDIHQSMAGETPQARREARYQLAGIVGMMSLMAGVTGTIGFNLAMAVAGMVLGDDDDPLDFAERFKADVVDVLGPELGGVILNGVPGHYLGIDLSNRIGMPDLWFRSPTRELQGKQEFQYWLSQTLGATAGLAEQLFTGASLVLDGDVARGVEMMAPKAIRDLMKSYRYGEDGLTTIDGNTMMTPERIGWHGMIAQGLGFTPAAVSETWDRNTALKNAEKRIMDERQMLINKWAMAAIEGDKEAIGSAIDAIVKFNKVPLHAGVAIKKTTLQRSIKTRASNEAKREDGTLIRNEILSERLRAALSDRIYD